MKTFCNVQGIHLGNKMKCYNSVDKWPKTKTKTSPVNEN